MPNYFATSDLTVVPKRHLNFPFLGTGEDSITLQSDETGVFMTNEGDAVRLTLDGSSPNQGNGLFLSGTEPDFVRLDVQPGTQITVKGLDSNSKMHFITFSKSTGIQL